jgi:opacity protein-like surface antigen
MEKREKSMRKSLFGLAALLIGSPALAGYPYAGIQVGTGGVRASDVDETVVYTSTPAAPGDPSTLFYDDVFSARWDRALDVGLIAGFDLGWFRIEGELSHKRAKIDHHASDDIADQFLGELNSGLNRPSQAPDPGAPGLPALTLDDFQPSGTFKVGSAMVNAFVDVPIVKGFSIYAGAGLGRSFARGFGDDDGALARQKMVGAHYAVSDRFELGLRYRKFASGIIKLNHDPIDYLGNPNQVGGGPGAQTTNAAIAPDIEGEFRTRGLLLSLTYSLR